MMGMGQCNMGRIPADVVMLTLSGGFGAGI